MQQTFANRIALVTGAGSGIGRQLSINLAREGAAVAAIDLHPEPLASLAAELPGLRLACAVADVTDRTAFHQAVKQVSNQLGPIDLLIANAGIGMENSALAFRAEDFSAQIRVNLVGVANSVEAVLPAMLERRQGHLVAISSLASFRGLPKLLGYCASKAGVNALMDGLRFELKPMGIDVTTICPGWIRTPMTARISLPVPQMMDLSVAVERILNAIRRRKPFHTFPSSSAWKVRLLGWLPCGVSDLLTRRAIGRLGKPPGAD
jgi:NAD(P)-dependent dehydrogenase (short-subunit alcohol dehydrogenase family)